MDPVPGLRVVMIAPPGDLIAPGPGGFIAKHLPQGHRATGNGST